MRFSLLLLLVIIHINCKSVEKRTLLYGKCKKNYLSCTQFELSKDKTFKFYIFMDVGGGNVIKGKWDFVNEDTIKLNTLIQPKIQKSYTIEKINPEKQDVVKVKIRDYSLPLESILIDINNGEKQEITNSEGICYFKVDKISNVTYYYLNDRIETFQIKEPEANEIEIFIRDIESSVIPKYFTDELIVVNQEKLTFYPNNVEKKFTLKRSKFGKRYWK